MTDHQMEKRDEAKSSLSLPPVSVEGHRLQLLASADQRHSELLDTIGTARSELQLFYYRFADDNFGREVLSALIDARRRGVNVVLLIDRFGCRDIADTFFDPLREAGATVEIFSSRRSLHYLIRNHQKMLIADRQKAVIGGFNIDENYFDEGRETGWRDFGLSIEGEAAGKLAGYFDQLDQWCDDGAIRLAEVREHLRNWSDNQGPLRWLLGGPSNRLSPWAQQVKRDLQQGDHMDIAAAYFSPGPAMLRRIGKLARRGRCRLVMAGKSDNSVTIAASRLLYGFLLKRDAEIYEFRPQRLHAKLLVIDDVVYIGSANFDMRSLFINLEIMLRIESPDLARQMRGVIDDLAVRSDKITDAHPARSRNPFTRLRQLISYLIVGVLDFTVSRGFND